MEPGTRLTICCPEGISAPTKRLIENLGISTPEGKIPTDSDLAILVDTNALDQLGRASTTTARTTRTPTTTATDTPSGNLAKTAVGN